MTAPRYSPDQLHSLDARVLDAVVAEVVMGWVGPFAKSFLGWHGARTEMDSFCPLPYFSTTYEGFGQIAQRMRELGFGTDFGSMSQLSWEANFVKDFRVWRKRDASLPRATAIAAVLAVQGVGHV